MSEYEEHGPRYQKIGFESSAEDTRNIVGMLADAILRSPTGEPFFMLREQVRYDALAAAEAEQEADVAAARDATEVVAAAEDITMRAIGETALVAVQGEV